MPVVDKKYCMSSYLMYRYVIDAKRLYREGMTDQNIDLGSKRKPVKTSDELLEILRGGIRGL